MMIDTVKIPTKEELLEVKDAEIIEESVDEPSEQEQRAMDDGWVPKDQWKGNPDDWRPAKEFNDRGELFSRIKSQSKEIAELKQATSFLTNQHKEQYMAGVKDTIEKLKAQRNEALQEGDIVRAAEVGDRIDEVKEEMKQAKATEVDPKQGKAELTEIFKSWHSKNPWYMNDEDTTFFADAKGLNYRKKNPDSSEADMLAYVTKEVHKVFPDKFPNKAPPSPNGGGRESPRGRGGENTSSQMRETESNMTDEQRGIMKTILKSTGMTKEEYFKQYA